MLDKQDNWYRIGMNGKGLWVGECLGHNTGYEPMNLTGCNRYMLIQVYEGLLGGSFFLCDPANNFKGHKLQMNCK